MLEARDMARVAYDAAKSAGRILKAKQAHDSILADVHRAQAHALAIRARAEMRLAEEYDAAQARGEVAGHGRSKVEPDNVTTAADLGLRRDEIHEARKLRDAEKAEPGLIQSTLDALIDRGEEPTIAKLRSSILAAVEDARRRPRSDRKNPNYVPNPMRDRVLTFIDHCEQLSLMTDWREVAAYDDPQFINSTIPRRDRCAEAALKFLNAYMEFKNA